MGKGTRDQAVIIDLHGSKAERGIELDGLQQWLGHFRQALRDFERSRSPRRERVRRTGRPGAVSDVATGFRLIHFRIGSGIAELEPLEWGDEDQLDLGSHEAPAVSNLLELMEAVERADLERAVVGSLDEARRSIGEDGHFGLLVSDRRDGRTQIDAETIGRLQAATRADDEATPKAMTVSGNFHFVDVEEPERVAIRDAAGVDWICTYPQDLEDEVLPLVQRLGSGRGSVIVWAAGVGARTGLRKGTMHLSDIAEIPTHDQSPLFTFEPVPVEELERQHGVERPQGLAALSDPEWADDEQDRAYLAFLLGDRD